MTNDRRASETLLNELKVAYRNQIMPFYLPACLVVNYCIAPHLLLSRPRSPPLKIGNSGEGRTSLFLPPATDNPSHATDALTRLESLIV